jgi:allophanate hydrolase
MPDDRARSRVEEFLERNAATGAANVWIHEAEAAALRERADALDARPVAARGPLHGIPVAVKDNVDVAGMPTSAGAPAFTYVPDESSPAVQRLADAGAVIVGKTNLDQFATGLSGTRAPAYGVCKNPIDHAYIAGGSSSGSAVAVAAGLVPLAVGTDTAGSGRVPAACCGIIGLKPTRGWVGTGGVVPASPSFDTVSLFARSVGAVTAAFTAASRAIPASPIARRVGIPKALDWFGDDDARRLFERAQTDLAAGRPDLELVRVDIDMLLAAGELLYGSALLAERYASFGEFIEQHPDDVDPAVRALVLATKHYDAASVFTAQQRLASYRNATATLWNEIDVLVLPTIARHPSVAEALDDSIATSRELGTYTAFVNLLDLAAISFPIRTRASGLPFGVTAIGPAHTDGTLIRFAARWLGEEVPVLPAWPRLVVVGAHMRGLPLNPQLTALGARFVGATTTGPHYRLYDLGVDPLKPGMVRDAAGGSVIAAEIWELPPPGFATFVAGVPAPLCIGNVVLADGTTAPGFLCEPHAVVDKREVTAYGGWRAYLADVARY